MHRRFIAFWWLVAHVMACANAPWSTNSIALGGEKDPQLTIDQQHDQLHFRINDQTIATYSLQDYKIKRPHFSGLRTAAGSRITRAYPPREGVDLTDHATMHPGLWLAFGDINGVDFWRNKGQVKHQRFTRSPASDNRQASFVEEKSYHQPDGKIVCREKFQCTVALKPYGYLIQWDSTFYSDTPFAFGDQEEMGLGVRVATPLTELQGGRMFDSEQRQGAKRIWGNAASWCDYGVESNGQRMGITLLCHPDNFRSSWMHARNYGLLTANPFGRKAMGKGSTSRINVRPGETLRLRFGLRIYEAPTDQFAPASYYADYQRETEERLQCGDYDGESSLFQSDWRGCDR